MSIKDKRLIVVEDNVNNYNLILRLLTAMGIEHCEWVSSGYKATEESDQYGDVDLVLLDINLPYENGFEVHKKMRKHPSFKTSKIVAVTANASETYMQKAISEGFDGFIGKPLDPDRFPDQVADILNGKPVWEWQ